MKRMNEKHYCSTCKWYAIYEGTCCNGDSQHRADFRTLYDTCEEWEMNAELNPCPFCGSNSIRIWDGNHYWCQCNVCLASTAAEDTREEAVEDWNRRSNDEKVDL